MGRVANCFVIALVISNRLIVFIVIAEISTKKQIDKILFVYEM